MSENIYRRARIPFFYPLVFLLNVAVVIMLELLLGYTLPANLTEDILAQELPGYKNAVIEQTVESAEVYWYLVKTQTGDCHLIPARRHALFFNRCKLLDDQITVIPADTAEMEVTAKTGITASTLLVGTEVEPKVGQPPQPGLNMRPKWYGRSQAGTYAFAGYVFIGLTLSFLESFLWNKLRSA